jgi:hypothetical protein
VEGECGREEILSRLWAVTCYFNPAGYRRKLENYHAFRRHLTIPLVTVEHAHTGRFDLGPGDADNLVQVQGGDVMWQKERLLNVALAGLPGDCEFVAWIDCDTLFERGDWPAAAIRELTLVPMCQLFRLVYHLKPDADIDPPSSEDSTLTNESIGYGYASGLAAGISGLPGIFRFKRGHAWGARREVLDRHGFYDRGIVGGGDLFMAHAVTGQTGELTAEGRMPPALAADYLDWAGRFAKDVPSLGFVDQNIFHLYHGDLGLRRYAERMQILLEHDYDPATDIAIGPGGCWRWNSDKPGMHKLLQDYFQARAEDGEQLSPAENQP